MLQPITVSSLAVTTHSDADHNKNPIAPQGPVDSCSGSMTETHDCLLLGPRVYGFLQIEAIHRDVKDAMR